MKVRIPFKSPDAVYSALGPLKLDEEEQEDIADICGRWIQYDEYVTIEVDTEEKTCRIVPVSEL